MFKPYFIATFSAIALLSPSSSYAVDWAKVPATTITLLYPAQLSWEWLTDDDQHSGASKIAQGRACRSCHDNKEQESGALIVDYKPTEPSIIPGKPGSIKATVKAAHDEKTLFVQIQFDASGQPDAGQDKRFSDKVAMMIDDGNMPEAQRAGCWVACHYDANTMKNGTPAKTKYLRDAAQTHQNLEYWQARLMAEKPAEVIDGTISTERSESAKPLVKADAALNDGIWTVVFSRDLAAPEDRKTFVPGKTYTVGFSIHAGYTAHRFHYVSLEKTLVLDHGTADIVAARN